MRYEVPQFIEVEDKIVGHLTIKQFVYVAGGAGLIVALWILLPNALAFILAIPVLILSLALSFYKVHSRPFVEVLESAFSYFAKSKLYIWKKKEKKVEAETTKKRSESPTAIVPIISKSKLKDLAWGLDIKESIYSKPEQQK
jgi:hypothetical protein